MSMTTLGMVGAGVGAVALGGLAVLGGYLTYKAGKDMPTQKSAGAIALQIILTLSIAVFACSCGYTSFLLAKGIYTGVVPSLFPLSLAAASAVSTFLIVVAKTALNRASSDEPAKPRVTHTRQEW